MKKMRFIVKLAVKIIIVLIVLALWYLFENRFLEIKGIWTYIEKIFICCFAYGIHVIVEWIADKKFPSDTDDLKKIANEMPDQEVKSFVKSLDKNQLLCLAENKNKNTYCILTLDEKVFNLNMKDADKVMENAILLTAKGDGKEKCDVCLFLTISDSEETLLRKAKNELLEMDTVQRYKMNAPAGEVLVQIWKPIDKGGKYLTFFVYKVRENLYFEGNFWLTKDSSFNENELIAAIFQKVY